MTVDAPPLGPLVPGWTPRPRPPARVHQGRWCRLEPLDLARHVDGLFAAVCADPALWLYLPFECPDSVAALADLLARTNAGEAPHYQTFVILDPEGSQPLGIASFMRVDPAHGSLEVGFVVYGPQLQRTVAATEAQALLAAHVFDDLGYRRYEWKCNALNAASRRAAERLGFQFEGVFRNAGVVKGRSRDTAWYALTDADWPSVRAAFAAWLAPENIGPDGVARQPLTALRSR